MAGQVERATLLTLGLLRRAWQGFDEFMNVVLDDAEEIWVKDTKAKKAGDRQRLGALATLQFSLVRLGSEIDLALTRVHRSATAQGREHHAHQPGAEGCGREGMSAVEGASAW